MKTKFVRFNRLPKLDAVQSEYDSDPKASKISSKDQGLAATNTAFRKSDTQKFNQLLQIMDNLMKKSIRQVRDFELQARDRFVVVDPPEAESQQGLDEEALKQWVTDVCSNVFSSAFHSYSKDAMNYEQAKIFCSEGILRNIVLLTKKYRLTKDQIKVIDDHIQNGIVPYMQKKYPLTQTNDINKAVDEAVKSIDNREALTNDFLLKSDVVFTYRESGNYNDLIMKFLNFAMKSIDEKDSSNKTAYEQFYTYMSKIFTNVFNEQWMNRVNVKADRSGKSQKNIDLKSQKTIDQKTEDTNQKNENQSKNENIELNSKQPEPANDSGVELSKYAAQVKEYTSYLIGRKISQNIPTFTNEQIQSGYLNIKNPAILRILTKWCEQLWQKFKKKNYFLDREQNVKVQLDNAGQGNTMFMWMKIPLNDMIQKQKKQIQKFMAEVEENNYDQQAILLLRQLQKDNFTHIEKIQKACGKFAYKIVNNLHTYIVIYLNRIIHGLLNVSKELYDTKLATKARWTSPPNLLSFKIGDLMRCKCNSKERQILKIFEELNSISDDPQRSKILKIIRIKNRQKLGTNDILVNILFKDKYLCEMQLAVNSTKSKFIQCSNKFSHYIYELGRSIYGPLTQLCSVWMSLDPRAPQYLQIVKNQLPALPPQPIGCRKISKQHRYTTLDRPFVCSDCNIAYSHNNYIWQHQKCLDEDCKHMICARCRIDNSNPQNLFNKLFVGENIELRKHCKDIINREPKENQTIPTFGVCVEIESKRQQIRLFKKLDIKNITTIFEINKKKTKGQISMITELTKKKSEEAFFKKYLVFKVPDAEGPEIIDITIDKVKKDYIIPLKIKDIYKKQKQILSLIDENLDDKSCDVMLGDKDYKEGRSHIKNMELADNKLQSVAFIAANFPNLKRLQLSRNQIKDLSHISDLKHLIKLNLRDNKITELPDQICLLTELQGINIRNNKGLTKLPKDFGKLTKLNKIQSDNNQFEQLPESFRALVNLQFIDLSKNKLKSFPEVFKGFVKLKELYLAGNQIGQIPDWIDKFSNLQILDLKKTKLINLPENLFQLKKLHTLKFESSISNLSQNIVNLSLIKDLSIQMPNLKQLPEYLSKLVKLQSLEVEDTVLETLPTWLKNFQKLASLSLIKNKQSTVSPIIFQLKNLVSLRLQNQGLVSLPAELTKLENLRKIYLNKNKFKAIPEVIRQMNKIYELTIDSNQIVQIKHNFFDTLPNIETLALDNNQIRVLPESIKTLIKMKKLTFTKNKIENLPDWLKLLVNLVEKGLKLTDNPIKEIQCKEVLSAFGDKETKNLVSQKKK